MFWQTQKFGTMRSMTVKNKADLHCICQNIDAWRIFKWHSQESSIEIRAQKEYGLHPTMFKLESEKKSF